MDGKTGLLQREVRKGGSAAPSVIIAESFVPCKARDYRVQRSLLVAMTVRYDGQGSPARRKIREEERIIQRNVIARHSR